MKRLILEQGSEEFYTSHSGLALVGACINRYSLLGKHVGKAARTTDIISEADIVRSYLGLLCLGKSDYEAISSKQQDDYFRHSLGIDRVPSAERLRQRLDAAATYLIPVINDCSLAMLRRAKVAISPLSTGHISLDADVFPQDNSNTRKEGVGFTYKKFDGYAPIAAYLGLEGWCLEVELRPGSQHSQEGFIPFIRRAIARARMLTSKKLLVRLDSGHDAIDTLMELQAAEGVSYIVKWNPRNSNRRLWRDRVFDQGKVTTPRPGKRVATLLVRHRHVDENKKAHIFSRIVRVTERTTSRHGQLLLTPDITLEGWWTNLDLPSDKVIDLYKQHATSEQFHSELKTDLDLERLPSGKFATNALVMAMGAFAYNILRLIGQIGLLGQHAPIRHPAKRRRIKTVIQELIYLAGRLIVTGRRLKLRFSRHCAAFRCFREVYTRLLPAH